MIETGANGGDGLGLKVFEIKIRNQNEIVQANVGETKANFRFSV